MAFTEQEKTWLKAIMKSISLQFGDKCEVVLHDFSSGLENSIAAIENAHVTGREIGASITNTGLESLQNDHNQEEVYNYISNTREGKFLRSSAAVFRDEEGKIKGALCINFDISEFVAAEKLMQYFTQSSQSGQVREVFVKDVDELLEHYLGECVKLVGKSFSMMNKEDKLAAIRFLDEKGVFKITKSGNKVCEVMGISKFTLYNYLDEVRSA